MGSGALLPFSKHMEEGVQLILELPDRAVIVTQILTSATWIVVISRRMFLTLQYSIFPPIPCFLAILASVPFPL